MLISSPFPFPPYGRQRADLNLTSSRPVPPTNHFLPLLPHYPSLPSSPFLFSLDSRLPHLGLFFFLLSLVLARFSFSRLCLERHHSRTTRRQSHLEYSSLQLKHSRSLDDRFTQTNKTPLDWVPRSLTRPLHPTSTSNSNSSKLLFTAGHNTESFTPLFTDPII